MRKLQSNTTYDKSVHLCNLELLNQIIREQSKPVPSNSNSADRGFNHMQSIEEVRNEEDVNDDQIVSHPKKKKNKHKKFQMGGEYREKNSKKKNNKFQGYGGHQKKTYELIPTVQPSKKVTDGFVSLEHLISNIHNLPTSKRNPPTIINDFKPIKCSTDSAGESNPYYGWLPSPYNLKSVSPQKTGAYNDLGHSKNASELINQRKSDYCCIDPYSPYQSSHYSPKTIINVPASRNPGPYQDSLAMKESKSQKNISTFNIHDHLKDSRVSNASSNLHTCKTINKNKDQRAEREFYMGDQSFTPPKDRSKVESTGPAVKAYQGLNGIMARFQREILSRPPDQSFQSGQNREQEQEEHPKTHPPIPSGSCDPYRSMENYRNFSQLDRIDEQRNPREVPTSRYIGASTYDQSTGSKSRSINLSQQIRESLTFLSEARVAPKPRTIQISRK